MAASNDRRRNKLLECLKEDPVVTIACKKANIGRATYYRWLEDKDFAKQVISALQKGDGRYNDIAESKLMSLIFKEDIRAIMFRLNNKHPDYSYPKVLPYQKEPERPLKSIEVMGSIKGPDEKDWG